MAIGQGETNTMGAGQQYSKPPLIEAVLELRFESAFTERELTRLKDKLASKSSRVEELKTFQAKMEQDGAVKDMGLMGYRVTAPNGADIVLIQEAALATSRMAPYEGWDNLVNGARKNYAVFEKVIGFRRIVRIGARFINRIDVPNAILTDKYIGDLLNIKVQGPTLTANHRGPYSLALNFQHAESKLKVFAQVAVGDPVLIEHTPLFIDLDCAFDSEIPTNVEEVWKLVDSMRDPKDEIFESFLTPEVRGLFK